MEKKLGLSQGDISDDSSCTDENCEAEELPENEIKVDSGELAYHNFEGDDVAEIQAENLEKMDRFEQFQYRFPFHRMNLAGYQFHVKEAMHMFEP